MEREQLRAESALVVTVKSSSEFHDDITDGIEALKQGDAVDSTPTLSFTSYDDLMEHRRRACLISSKPSAGKSQPASTKPHGSLTGT